MALQAPVKNTFYDVETQISKLIASQLSVAVTDPTLPRSAAYPEEAACLSPMRAIRRKEFLAGRDALRQAIVGLRLPPCAIPRADDRSPCLPNGVCASLTHSAEMCIAIADLSSNTSGLGIDIEPVEGLDLALWDTVCTRAERAWLSTLPIAARPLAAKRIFCAKEAAYKCQFALSRALLDFHAFDVTFLGETSFQATFRQSVGPFSMGDRISGRTGDIKDHIICVARIPA